jgi:predicted nucleotidyltransferase
VPTAFDRLADLLRALADEQVRYVLFGGQAVNLHGIPRYTEDIDLFVDASPPNVERLRCALRRVWNDPAIDEITADDLGGEYAVVRYGTPDGFAIDVVSRIGDAFGFEDLDVQTLSIAGVPARVATPETLYRMKKDTVRPIDHADAADLAEKFGLGQGRR